MASKFVEECNTLREYAKRVMSLTELLEVTRLGHCFDEIKKEYPKIKEELETCIQPVAEAAMKPKNYLIKKVEVGTMLGWKSMVIDEPCEQVIRADGEADFWPCDIVYLMGKQEAKKLLVRDVERNEKSWTLHCILLKSLKISGKSKSDIDGIECAVLSHIGLVN